MKPFANEKPLDFTKVENVNKQKEALAKVNKQLGKEYPNIIGGKKVKSEKKTISVNPANTKEIVGIFQKSGQDQAEAALQTALKAFETWKYTPAKDRANILLKAAQIAKQRRLEINAWMIKEVGKNYAEADADTCEAIDFMEFYAREALRYAQNQPLTPYPGEKNQYFYIPLGVGLCVPPWNFPFAIMAGISSAAIVSGNTIILKPSSDAPMMAWLYYEIMHEAGLPKGVLNFFVASGAEAGDYLVHHPKIRFISFTGSMEVGLHINEVAAKASEGQIWIKRVVAEMGGKDTIVVDSEADIDSAVQGTVASAFGFQGQKCSACSRVVVDKKVYTLFMKNLKEAVSKLKIGNPEENIYSGPVVNASSEQKVLEYIDIGKKEGKLLIGGNKVAGLPGYFIEPTVFVDIKPNARLAQEEIFGPVLAVIKSNNFDDGLKIANNTIYGLTGSVYSKNRQKLERARQEFHVGNLYINRKCTGAIVDVHPFGGFNMSGTDSKAGSRDYLLLFMQGKSVSEKVK
ncbi:MAG: L-glutamate gamma-semialdehyde dehydrogenase [Ignavibacteria bacterium GWB2_35_12]|nr:MAG: L-glutamate gamma-semialdehyde dehydrogenase [Ignavibacteria bacterium GWA2_35_8]OGU41991.1 MAG: L-glutamate gamma-semialdehyde dehydrogenase [Ignavibacteria bacterium GWB2_35_12]OGU87274.1 MAG: L-glutamate gamma-semialdehyde dehydrogenase [Ignavibacteria bacterium RIFOXYA2_FULL_35_10]OGV24415.1 MAG: L-glutamate gamma-semialdehyde dehydrogenase [Ignavibacteria bacterium RIFOXYC2_FULL_35_21]